MRPEGNQFGAGIEDLIERMRQGISIEDAITDQAAENPFLAARSNQDIQAMKAQNRSLRNVPHLDIARQLCGQPDEVEITPTITGSMESTSTLPNNEEG